MYLEKGPLSPLYYEYSKLLFFFLDENEPTDFIFK